MPAAGRFCFLTALLLCSASSTISAPLPPPPPPSQLPSPSPSSAPAPSPAPCNIAQIIQSAGQFSSFLALLLQTGVAQKFQAQADQTHIGITVFAPVDKAFSTPPASTLLKNITQQQKVSLCEYHALHKWYSLASLQQIDNATSTYATFEADAGGRKYEFNVTDRDGNVQINTGWSTASMVSTLYNADACSIFAVDEVLLPEDVFGLPPPPPPPSPPSSGLPSASPSLQPASSSSGSSSNSSSSNASIASPLCCVHRLVKSLLLSISVIFLLQIR